MVEYIEREALLEFARNHKDGLIDCNDIARFPAADVVEVVRCKDCAAYYEYEDWDRHTQETYVCHECRLFKKDIGADGFCSCGERKET